MSAATNLAALNAAVASCLSAESDMGLRLAVSTFTVELMRARGEDSPVIAAFALLRGPNGVREEHAEQDLEALGHEVWGELNAKSEEERAEEENRREVPW